MIKNYGLILPEKIETREEGAEHLLGAAEKPVINESGDWIPYIPDKESQQQKGVETQSCTVYATLNALETLLKFKGYKVNYSDRYVANVAKDKGILDPYAGADPHKIVELIRKVSGLLKEEKLPWSDDIKTTEDYYTVKNLYELMKEGPKWYDEWQLEHEWVFGTGTPYTKRAKLEEAIQKGTVCVSVYAWVEENGKYIKPQGKSDNHWTQLARISPNEYTIFDSYDGYIKPLDPFYDFTFAKVYYLTPTQEVLKPIAEQLSWIQKVVEYLKALVNLISQPKVEEIKTLDEQVEIIQPEPKYKWGTKAEACHSVRVICDEEGLSVDEKNLIASVINCESGFNPRAVNVNQDKRQSTDYGICQYNDFWYRELISPDEALHNPEKSVRLMIEVFKGKHPGYSIKNWICYEKGLFRKFPSKIV